MTSGRAHGLGNHLNGHSDLVFPEPLEDLSEVTRPPFLQSELFPRPHPVVTVGQGTQGRGAVPIT